VSPTSSIGVPVEYQRRAGSLYTFARRNGLTTTHDVLARAASGDKYTADEYVQVVKTLHARGRTAELRTLLKDAHPTHYLNLCCLLANQDRRPTDAFDATVMFEAMFETKPGDKVAAIYRWNFVEALIAAGRGDELDAFLDALELRTLDLAQPYLLAANASNPFAAEAEDDPSAVSAWLRVVNKLLEWDRLEPIGLAPGPEDPMDRIVCASSGMVDGGPLVTVILPAHNPDSRVLTAVECLRAQSYQALEILIMDDASHADGARLLDEVASRDDRIRVIHLPTNGGTYRARNIAVAQYALGEYITVHDDDDWSHPRKIEIQVAHLEAHPDECANMTLQTRATPHLTFARINERPTFAQSSYSSLMVRRSALERVGPWDEINRAADGEMHDRLAAWSGRAITTVGRAPVAMLRIRPGSLTSGELQRGYIDPRRRWYAESYRHWHAAAAATGSLRFPDPSVSPRPFSAPTDMLRPRGTAHGATHVDILYGTDYRFPGGNSTLSCNEIEILLDHGYRVGMLQIDAPILGVTNKLHPRALELARHPKASVLTPRDEVVSQLTILRHPTVLQFVQPVRAPITTGPLILIVNHAPFEPDGTGTYYDMSTVLAGGETVFGKTPRVAPESALIRGLLTGLVDPRLLTPQNWNGVLSPVAACPRGAEPGRPFVMGRHSRDHLPKWPTSDVLTTVYPVDGTRDVRILGGAEFAAQRLGRTVDDAWTVYPYGSRPVADFLGELDFWVYFHGPELHESFGMAALEAMSAGLVTVLPRYMEKTFGEGALYADEADVTQLMEAVWADPSRYAAQSAAAIRTVRERFGAESLLRRVEDSLG
jgi:hypothetical protein